MKQALFLAAVLGAAAGQAQAQTPARFYATAAVGSSHVENDCHFTNDDCNTHDVGVKLIGGYTFGSGLSVEAGYLNFGKFVFYVAESGSHGQYYWDTRPSAFTLGGAYALPVANGWGMKFRLGIARVKTRGTIDYGGMPRTGSVSRSDIYSGVGVTYTLSERFKLEIGVDATKSGPAEAKRTARLISLGTTVAF
jgi:OOP family OmpA-OmpF porin